MLHWRWRRLARLSGRSRRPAEERGDGFGSDRLRGDVDMLSRSSLWSRLMLVLGIRCFCAGLRVWCESRGRRACFHSRRLLGQSGPCFRKARTQCLWKTLSRPWECAPGTGLRYFPWRNLLALAHPSRRANPRWRSKADSCSPSPIFSSLAIVCIPHFQCLPILANSLPPHSTRLLCIWPSPSVIFRIHLQLNDSIPLEC